MANRTSARRRSSDAWDGQVWRVGPTPTLLLAVEVDVGVTLWNLVQISGISLDHFKFWVVLDVRNQLILADFIVTLGCNAGLLAAGTVGGHGVDLPARFHVVCFYRS